jgi:hypothetical protein
MGQRGSGKGEAGPRGTEDQAARMTGEAAGQGRALLRSRIQSLLGEPAVAAAIHAGLRRRIAARSLRVPERLSAFCRDDRGSLRLSGWGGASPGAGRAGAACPARPPVASSTPAAPQAAV